MRRFSGQEEVSVNRGSLRREEGGRFGNSELPTMEALREILMKLTIRGEGEYFIEAFT